MTAPEEYFDVNAEPSKFDGRFEPDPKERQVPPIDGHEDEISTVRDSVQNEPAFTGQLQQAELSTWLAQKRAQCTIPGSIFVTLVAAMVAGPFAVVGAFMAGHQTIFRILYLILFAPVIEEFLKQSGMIYLLEKKPYRIFSAGQFIIAAVISAAIFASIENLLYIHFYTDAKQIDNFAGFCCYRWITCTSLHIICSVIASMGLARVWKKQKADGRAVNLAIGFNWFITAMIIHGLYNLAATIVDPHF
ncbi:MAG: PrsW family glutamic-type intramembrane protease [Planctomycetota bacterium]